MKKMTVSLMAIAIGLAAISGAPAFAAPVGIGLGAHAGYGESKDADSGSMLAGAHIVLNVLPFLGVVGMVDYKFEEDHSEAGQDYTVKSYPLTAMGRFYIPIASFSPYVAAGVQYRLINYGGDLFEDTELDDSDSSFGWLVGAGAEFDLNENFAFFGEVRYEASDPDRDVENAIEDAKDFKYDQWSVRGGITFFLN